MSARTTGTGARARAAAAAACGFVLALAAPARAAEDGGTRSVFAFGAGNRALALGSAFGAVADDASALLWNPGGLGDVRRAELQVSHAELNDLGFRETFASVVYPDYRWGAAAVTLRHYGVDGIDGRDERNAPTGEFADRETEIALGYGRGFGDAWSLGVGARVRRQELAGRSGSGLGLDVGLKVRPGALLAATPGWMEGVQVGLALQNVVEPGIRLDREEVADPATLRAGLSYTRPSGFGDMMLVLELEKPREVGTRAHAGLELRTHPMLALRSGLDGGALTAGAGFQYRATSFDYAFVDQPTGPTHRAGITWRFGASVDEARTSAAHAEEERVQRRLAALEHEREAARVGALLDAARTARAAGRHDEALESLATLLAIDSTHAEARSLRAAALADRARALEAAGDWAEASVAWSRALAESPGDPAAVDGLARARAEGDRRARRTTEIRAAFAAALDAFAADDLAGARAGFARILAQQPDDPEAGAMLRRVDAAIARRTSSWLRQADALAQARSFAEASVVLERVRRLDPRAPGLAAATASLARAEAAQAARTVNPARTAAPAAAAQPLGRDAERQLAELYRRALAALERGDSDEALRALELVRSIRPAYARADEILEREYQTRGMELFSSGQLDAAIRMWERALEVDPKDARTLGYLARAHEQLARAREISEGGR